MKKVATRSSMPSPRPARPQRFTTLDDQAGELDARERCLRALVVDVAAVGRQTLVLEQDDSLLWWEQQRLIEITREVGCRDTLRYEHRRAEHELLLAVPDAIAWLLGQGRPLARLRAATCD